MTQSWLVAAMSTTKTPSTAPKSQHKTHCSNFLISILETRRKSMYFFGSAMYAVLFWAILSITYNQHLRKLQFYFVM